MALYGEYRSKEGKRPPSTEELKKWVKKTKKPEELKSMGIEDLDQLFISPRDHEPFVIVPRPIEMMGHSKGLIHEKTGVGGERLVLGSEGHIFHVRDEELHEYVPKSPR